MAYLLDSDTFITAKNGPYAFELCPGFWEWLDESMQSGAVASVQAVLDELTVRDDELSDWAKERSEAFLAPTPEMLRATGELIQWSTRSEHYNDRAKNSFADSADVRLIAHAAVRGDIVVTHERPSNEEGRIKIPIGAAEVGVRVMNAYTMLRNEDVAFVRSRPRDQERLW